MKKAQQKKEEWLQQGHGEYSEIPEEKEFFNVTKNSENVVCHFYRDETFRCKILDKHLAILAKKHVETKFCKINAEKTPFLCDRLKIKVIQTFIISYQTFCEDCWRILLRMSLCEMKSVYFDQIVRERSFWIRVP